MANLRASRAAKKHSLRTMARAHSLNRHKFPSTKLSATQSGHGMLDSTASSGDLDNASELPTVREPVLCGNLLMAPMGLKYKALYDAEETRRLPWRRRLLQYLSS